MSRLIIFLLWFGSRFFLVLVADSASSPWLLNMEHAWDQCVHLFFPLPALPPLTISSLINAIYMLETIKSVLLPRLLPSPSDFNSLLSSQGCQVDVQWANLTYSTPKSGSPSKPPLEHPLSHSVSSLSVNGVSSVFRSHAESDHHFLPPP